MREVILQAQIDRANALGDMLDVGLAEGDLLDMLATVGARIDPVDPGATYSQIDVDRQRALARRLVDVLPDDVADELGADGIDEHHVVDALGELGLLLVENARGDPNVASLAYFELIDEARARRDATRDA